MKKKQLFIAAFTAIFAALLIAGCPQKPKNKKNTEIKISAVRIGKFICAENGVTEIEANEADLTVEFAENYSGLTVKVNGKPASLNGKTATVKILNINETGRKIKIEAAAQGRENRTFEFTLKKKCASEITITIKPDGEHLRLKSFNKNFFTVTTGSKWKDIKQIAEELLEFEDKYKMGECFFENSSAVIGGEEIFNESKTVIVRAAEIKTGIEISEDGEMVHLKINGVVAYEIGFIDPVNGYIKERLISDSFAIAKTEITFEIWEKVYKWATEEKDGEKYVFVNKGFCGGRRNEDKSFAENTGDGKQQPVVKISPRDAIVWCNAYSEMNGLTPVYYEFFTDIEEKSKEEIAALILRDSSKGIKVDAAKQLTAKQAKQPNGKNGYRLPLPDEWELAALLSKTEENTIEKYKTIVNGEDWFFTKSDSASGAKKNYKDSEECKRVAWYKSNSEAKTHPVKLRAANDLGLYDMSGNAAEWCCGFNGDGYYMFRGGDWFNGGLSLQLGNFMFFFPSHADVNLGFRVAKTLYR